MVRYFNANNDIIKVDCSLSSLPNRCERGRYFPIAYVIFVLLILYQKYFKKPKKNKKEDDDEDITKSF